MSDPGTEGHRKSIPPEEGSPFQQTVLEHVGVTDQK